MPYKVEYMYNFEMLAILERFFQIFHQFIGTMTKNVTDNEKVFYLLNCTFKINNMCHNNDYSLMARQNVFLKIKCSN